MSFLPVALPAGVLLMLAVRVSFPADFDQRIVFIIVKKANFSRND